MSDNAPDLERVVQLEHDGTRYTFRVDRDGPLSFWRVHRERVTDGREEWGVELLPLRVMGDEGPEFFRAVVKRLAAERPRHA